MAQKITLNTPILIDGKEVTELTHDALKITAEQFLQASALAVAKKANKTASLEMRENDYALHFYLGCFAIITVNPRIDVEDLKRVSGYDILAITDIGWLFTVRRSEAPSEASTSAAPNETPPDTST